jgi:hypothetical protein
MLNNSLMRQLFECAHVKRWHRRVPHVCHTLCMSGTSLCHYPLYVSQIVLQLSRLFKRVFPIVIRFEIQGVATALLRGSPHGNHDRGFDCGLIVV